MDGETLFTLVANTGFAIGIAAYLVKWLVDTVNANLQDIVNVQKQIAEIQKKILEFEEQIYNKVSKDGGRK